MADITAKIIHRIGADDDLPQLEPGEFGFSTDERKLYIGNDPTLYPIGPNVATTQTEVLTRYSEIDVTQITGLAPVPIILDVPATDGQVMVYSTSMGAITNRGGTVPGKVNLGSIENIKISGGFYNYTLETDGLGNLSWNSKGTITANIKAISAASPCVMTIANTTPITNRAIVTIAGVQGFNTSFVNGKHFHVKVSGDFTTSGNVELYSDTDLTVPVDTTGLIATVNTGRSVHTSYNKVVTGSDQYVQFNDKGIMGSDSAFSFNKYTNTLSAESITGNITVAAQNQSNITTVGTLTSLTVAGNGQFNSNVNINGNLAVQTNVRVINNVVIGKNLDVLDTANIQNLNVGNLVADDAIILGNLRVQGNTVHTNVEEMTIEDPLLTIGGGVNGANLTANDGRDRGLIMKRYDTAGVQSFIGWDHSAENFVMASNVSVLSEIVTVNKFGLVKMGDLETVGNVLVHGTSEVEGSSRFRGESLFLSNVSIGQYLEVIQSVQVDKNINITGNSSITGNSVTEGNSFIGGTLEVAGSSLLTGNVVAQSNLQVAGNVLVSGSTVLTGDVSSLGNSSVAGKLEVAGSSLLTGNVVAQSNLQVAGNVLVSGSTVLIGNVTVANSVTISGLVSIANNLSVTGTSTANIFVSTVATGTSPFTVNSSTLVANLRSDTSNLSSFSGNVVGGNSHTIVVQTGISSTGFIDAPTVANTALVWSGSDFEWQITDSGNVLGGDTNQILFQTGPNVTGFIDAPTVTNTALKWDGVDFVWGVGGATIVNDVTTVANMYPLFADSTTGSAETIYTSDAKYLYKPEIGELKVPALVATNGIILNSDTLTANYTIQSGVNGMSVGPFTVAPGASLVLSPGQRHVII